MRWPGQIPPGQVCPELVTTLEILPTVAQLAGAPLPRPKLDGFDIWPLLSGVADSKSPRKTFLFYWQNELHAVRHHHWKLQLPHSDKQTPDPARIGHGGRRGAVMTVQRGLALYDLSTDPGETKDLSSDHPEIVRQLEILAEEARAD